ncbi:MAG TPA: maleylacetoacetate isomerase [Stellaceae bacterium]|nr:maleylacetoacetate isomerase [Stellaceae bacterium]
MKLYGYFRSSAAFRVRIALNFKGLDYEQAFIHLRKGDQRSAAYLGLNPQGLVPALIAEDGAVLTQSLSIIEYLEEIRPDPALLPRDSVARARVRSLAEAIACDIHPIDNLRVLQYLSRQFGHKEPDIETWFNHWIALGFEGIEKTLASDGKAGKFCHGDTPGLADICLVPQVVNARRYPSFDLGRYPTIMRINENCLKVAAFERAMPENQPDAE